MNVTGSEFTGMIIDENKDNYFVQKEGQTFRLPKAELEEEAALGTALHGFGYEDQEHHLRFTTRLPEARPGHFAFGTVTASRRDLGVFVDVGLPEKDIVVSLDELPTMHELWPKKGDRLMVTMRTDDKNRLWGELADEKIFSSLGKKAPESMKNHDITGTVYRLKLAGSYVLTDDYYLGYIHPSERYQEPRLGEVVKGRVIGVNPYGVLNLSLKPRAYETINQDAEMLKVMLEQANDHFLPFNDHSAPEDIQKHFAMSKGQFKRALGHLLKNKEITQNENGIQLANKTVK